MQKLTPGLVRQLFVLVFIVIVGILIVKELVPYLSGILGATTLYVLLRRSMVYLVKRGWNVRWAAVFLMSLSVIGILLPVALVAILLTTKAREAIVNSKQIIDSIKDHAANLEKKIGIEITSQIDSSQITGWISNTFESFAGSAFTTSIAMGLMYFMLYYMLTNRRQMRESLIAYIPLSVENVKIVGLEVRSLVKSNAIGIPLVAVMQGLVALVGFWVLGVPDIFFWFVITTIGSMIPFIGTAIGIFPVCILLLTTGRTWEAVALFVYGIVVVGSTDNLFRLVVQKRLADVHPLITLLGVIVGVPLFGFIGLIFGPLLVSLFLLIVHIYKVEYGKTENKL